MEYPAGTRGQQRKLSEWIVSGFERYIEVRMGSAGQDGCVRRYAEEFSRIITGNAVEDDDVDLPNLRKDIQLLVDKNCPALDVVEFMLACTSGLHATFSDGLRVVGLTERHLTDLRRVCAWAAEIIEILRRPWVPGPFLFLEESLPDGVDVEKVRRQMEDLPDALTKFAYLLGNCPPVEAENPWVKAFSNDGSLSFFYLLLHYFGCGFETLSRLLTTMRHVKSIVSPDTEYLHRFAPTIKRSSNAHTSDEPPSNVRDPFTEKALQRAWNRFSHKNDEMTALLKETVRRYLSPEWAERRLHGETLGTLLGQLWETMPGGERSE